MRKLSIPHHAAEGKTSSQATKKSNIEENQENIKMYYHN